MFYVLKRRGVKAFPTGSEDVCWEIYNSRTDTMIIRCETIGEARTFLRNNQPDHPFLDTIEASR